MSTWFPKNISTYGGEIDNVFFLILYIVGIWFVVSEVALIYFIIRFRKREGVRASYIDGENCRQLAWILVPAAAVFLMDLGIDFAGVSAYESIKGEMPAREEIVRVTGKQFNWDVTYPGSDGAFDTADDLTLENELHVPVGTVVHVVLESKDVIHSFFVPVFRLKQDVLPGRSITAWFEATETGEYEIGCAELCGYGHYKMRAVLTVHSAVDYASWIQEQWGS